MTADRYCEHCQRRHRMMEVCPAQPGLFGLLRGEGNDPGLNVVARLAVLIAVFTAAVAVFALVH